MAGKLPAMAFTNLVSFIETVPESAASSLSLLLTPVTATLSSLFTHFSSFTSSIFSKLKRRVKSKPYLFILLLLTIAQLLIYLYLWRKSGRYTFPMMLRRSKHFRSVIYINTHKTGSSTLSRILYSYGVMNGLNFAHEPDKEIFQDGIIDPSKLLPKPAWEPYHIICQHFVYNRSVLRTFMPKKSFTFTSMRQPVELFMSGECFSCITIVTNFNIFANFYIDIPLHHISLALHVYHHKLHQHFITIFLDILTIF